MAEEIEMFKFVKPLNTIDMSDRKQVGIPATAADSPYLGKYVCVGPVDAPGVEENSNQQVEVNFTAAPGAASGIYYGLVFQLLKSDWNVTKADEWIEVSPTHREYYERTVATKGAIEGTIKQGLASAAQAVADFELVKHDFRKYKEIADYFDAIEKAKLEKDKEKRIEKLAAAEHVLKSMFIDQVDIHTGQFSILQMIGSRWPNLIADFMQLIEEDDNVKKISERLKISHAEAVVLKTKNTLFREWMKLFKDAVKERYERLYELITAREKSVEEYRDWIKPHIARYRTLKLGAERKAAAAGLQSFADLTGQSTFNNKIKIYAWKKFRAVEHKKSPTVIEKTASNDFNIDPWDDYVREKLVLDGNHGLAKLYPWLRHPSKKMIEDKKIKEKIETDEEAIEKRVTVADELAERVKKNWNTGMRLNKAELYYMLLDFGIDRVGLRLPVGEIEDITFEIKMWVLSQNVLLVKIMELNCREMEIEKYIDQILGLRSKKGEDVKSMAKRDFPQLFGEELPKGKTFYEKVKAGAKEVRGAVTRPFEGMPKVGPSLGKYAPYLLRAGPYETSFNDRITKLYLIPTGRTLGELATLLMNKMGVE